MEKNYSIFMPCNKAQHVCDKSQYREASLLEKIKLSMHLVFCKVCQKYTKNNSNLTKIMKKESVKTYSIETSEKLDLQNAFDKELARQQSNN